MGGDGGRRVDETDIYPPVQISDLQSFTVIKVEMVDIKYIFSNIIILL